MTQNRAQLLRRRVAQRGLAPAPRPVGSTTSLVAAFAAVAAEHPDRVAVQDGTRTWTYRQLDETADRLAAALTAVTADPGRPVGILLERSVWMVAAALAVVRTGSSYLPLDPGVPAARLAMIVAEADPAAVITSRALSGKGPAGVPAVLVDEPLPETAGSPAGVPVDGDTRAYLIFTSGTTGRPKGVQVSHGNLLSLLKATEQVYDFGPGDVWTLFHSFSFDFSVWEMWGALLYGGRLVVVPAETAKDPAVLRELLRDEQVTVLCQTPSVFAPLAAEDSRFADRLPLRWVILGGETLHFADLAPWFAKYGDESPRLVNGYGITETTILSSFHRVTEDQLGEPESLIGRPVAGTGFLVLDDDLAAVPAGEIGELVVTGPGVSPGYLNRPGLTAERFVDLPGGRGRGYRSGDLVRSTPAGVYAFHGRRDDQVKIRGYRIELGEIEQALRALPGLAEAAVVARDLPGRGNTLVAYVVAAGDPLRSTEALRASLAVTLPGYMIPRLFVRLDRLPLTVNGKTDRRALPDPDPDTVTLLRAPGDEPNPADPVEDGVLRIIGELLHLDRADPAADFFDLGGHSLLAARVLAGVRTAFGVEVPLREFLRRPTARALAAVVRERLRTPSPGGPSTVVMAKAPDTPGQPATDAQRRLYFLSEMEPDSAAYHLHTALVLDGDLDVPALEGAFTALVERHHPLRTVLRLTETDLTQVVRPAYPVRLPVEQLPREPGEDWRDSAARLAREESRRLFDLHRDPMIRVRLIRVTPTSHLLLVTVHHIAADGWSVGVLSRELRTSYAHARGGPAPAPLRYTFADYAYSMRRWLAGPQAAESLAYWERRLAGAPVVHRLPLDHPRPSPAGAVDCVTTTVTGPVAETVRQTCRDEQVTLFVLLQAAFSVLLARRCGSDDIVLGTAVAGRPSAGLDDVIGMFVNTLVLRTRVDLTGTFRDLLARVREETGEALEHPHVPLAVLAERLRVPHHRDHAPLYQLMLVLQNNEAVAPALDGLDVSTLPVPEPGAQAELLLDAVERDGDLVLRWRYDSGLFRPDTITGLAEEFSRLLEELSATAGARTVPLDGSGRSAPAGALIRLRQSPSPVPPVFALPGVLGLGESFAQLSAHFPGRCFYALSTADLVGDHDGHLDAPALAGACARIITATAGGPVHLVGHSYGGSLALHIAGHLRDSGTPAAGLVLLDALDPGALAEALAGDRLPAFLGLLGGLFPDLARHRGADLARLLRTESTASILNRVRDAIGPHGAEFFHEGIPAAFRTYQRMCDLRWPAIAPVATPALLVRAGAADPSGWAPYLSGTLRVEDIDADHEGMLRNPHARRLAGILGPFLLDHDGDTTPR
ncbi:amino acid adenylation domain-containing protein [Actinoplanes sp. NPDC049802]|uniref:amino acid adenylation domain-containing protein n=1 Tax=Actinoplanes sp. NPDC049802 TaxID=3154742 RepID=UPI0033FFFCE9